MEAAEQRLDGAIAYRALVRYDAYGELSGHQSTTLALLDAARNGVVLSSIAHRDTARLYVQEGARRRPASTSSRPRRTRRSGSRCRASCARSSSTRLMRVGYLGPERDLLPGGADDRPGRGRLGAGRAADQPRHGHRRPRRDRRPRARPDRELARGRRQPDARRARLRDRRRRDRRRADPPDPPLPRRARGPSSSTRSAPSSPTRRRPRSARASSARACGEVAVVPAASTAEAVRLVAEGSAAGRRPVGGARQPARRGPLRLRGPARGRRGHGRQRDPLRVDRARGHRRRRARSLEDLARVLGRGRRGARLARALPVRVRVPRRQPHPHRVAPAQGGPRPLHVLRRPRGPRRPTRPSPAPSWGCAGRPRPCVCWGPTPLRRSAPRARPRRDRLGTLRLPAA